MAIWKKYLLFMGIIFLITIGIILYFKKNEENRINLKESTDVASIFGKENVSIAHVVRVIDGDTIVIEGNQKIRYIGMDTPEIHHPTKPVQCFGKEAAEINKQLVDGKTIYISKDISEKDIYGRLLRYVWIKEDANSPPLFINYLLVRNGYAHATPFPPDVTYESLFRQAEREARNENLGLWKSCLQ